MFGDARCGSRRRPRRSRACRPRRRRPRGRGPRSSPSGRSTRAPSRRRSRARSSSVVTMPRPATRAIALVVCAEVERRRRAPASRRAAARRSRRRGTGSSRGRPSTSVTFTPHRGEHRRVLAADDAAADDEHRLRQAVDLQDGVGVVDVLVVERDVRRVVRLRAGGDEEHLARQPPRRAAGARDLDGVRVDEARDAAQQSARRGARGSTGCARPRARAPRPCARGAWGRRASGLSSTLRP